MQDNLIKAVLFDFGGVLAEEGFRNGLLALAREQGLDEAAMPVLAMQAVYDCGFVLGKASATDFWALLRERSGLQGDDDDLSRRILAGFTIRPWLLDYVQQLHERGLLTGILSDQTHWLDELDNRYHFMQYFDYIYNSYYRGKGKRDASVFTEVAGELGLPVEAILFVDDDAGNVERARSRGMQVLQYVDQRSFLDNMQHRYRLVAT